MSADHIHFFFHLRNQIKLHHWQTHLFSRHKATDSFLKSLEKNIDTFVELYIGRHGRPILRGSNAVITLHNLTEAGATRMLRAAVKYLEGPLDKSIQGQADLLNKRDEILGDVDQLLYLFTLH